MQVRCCNCFHEYEDELGLCPFCGYEPGDESGELYSLPPGTQIAGRYMVGQTLGVGGFGITYLAWDLQLRTTMAIKEYFPAGLANRAIGDEKVRIVSAKREQDFLKGRERFLDEARNMAKFNRHSTIVNVFDFFEANNTAYIVMEYLEGMTLSQVIHYANGPMTPEQCGNIAISVCDALEAIHNEGILHRDVSPDNLMIRRDGSVKLFDFGAARFSKDSVAQDRADAIVKPGFAPMEQYITAAPQGPYTDIYALGATMYYALTGVKPEEATNRRVADGLRPPKELVPQIPDYLNTIVMRAMAMEPEMRFASAPQLRQALQDKQPVDTVEQIVQKQKNRRLATMLAAAVAVVAGLGVLLVSLLFFGDNLPDGTIQVWYQEDSPAEAAAWQAVAEQFMAEYPNVTVELTGYDADSYEEKLDNALARGSAPDLFESTTLSDSELKNAADLSGLIKDLNKDGYAGALEGAVTQYPTGLVVPMVYVNTSIGNLQEAGDYATIQNICQSYGSTVVANQERLTLLQGVYGAVTGHSDALEIFLNGEAMAYLGTNADYLTIQEGLVHSGKGSVKVLLPNTGESTYAYGQLWSCDQNASKDDQEIAKAFLAYLNSDYAQDYLNIRNFATSGCIPATESGVKQFLASYSDLEGTAAFLDKPFTFSTKKIEGVANSVVPYADFTVANTWDQDTKYATAPGDYGSYDPGEDFLSFNLYGESGDERVAIPIYDLVPGYTYRISFFYQCSADDFFEGGEYGFWLVNDISDLAGISRADIHSFQLDSLGHTYSAKITPTSDTAYFVMGFSKVKDYAKQSYSVYSFTIEPIV